MSAAFLREPDNEFELGKGEHDDAQKGAETPVHDGYEHVIQSARHALVFRPKTGQKGQANVHRELHPDSD